MQRFLFPLSLVAASIAAPAMAQEATSASALTQSDAEALQGAVERGLTLHQYDQAAWHTTDAMLEDLPKARQRKVRGWIVEPDATGWIVTYWGDREGALYPVYSAHYADDRVSQRTIHPDDAPPLGAQQVEIANALQVVAANVPDEVRLCDGNNFNPVVMPTGKPEGGQYVYLLTPQTSLSAIPLGGHYRFEVRDGKIAGFRKFTNSCIDLRTEAEGKGKTVAALGIVHFLDPVPTEIHVFSALAAKVPIFASIVEPRRTFVIDPADGQVKVTVEPLED